MEFVPEMYATFWALVPPIVAIVLALITKEAYSSLFIGIVMGGLFFGNAFTAGFDFERSVTHIFQDGFVGVLSDPDNVGILIFLVLLGIMVSMMNQVGGSKAFGQWAQTHIKTKVGAQLSTVVLGLLIFIDDYFNCLTVGSVMRPVTDSHKISRAKLAYLIDATAAPVCIIAPISSWAAAVTGFVEGEDGFSIFINAIPYNFYAILTIVAVIAFIVFKVDFGPMRTSESKMTAKEQLAQLTKQLEQTKNETDDDTASPKGLRKGKVIDLIFPVIVLIISCVIGMLYTGDFFKGVDFITAFSNCSAAMGLLYGSAFAFLITFVFYLCRRVISFKKLCECIPEGFKAMVPAILILTLAWTLKTMTDSLGAKEFVANLIGGVSTGLLNFLPVVIFIVAMLLAFATGTSWGTFGILIPIVVSALSKYPDLMIIAISACMAGAVCGDHCSPISDTTIMASAGAQCDHMEHVSTQLPYVMFVAAISAIAYIIAGILKSPVVPLIFGVVAVVGVLFIIKLRTNKKTNR